MDTTIDENTRNLAKLDDLVLLYNSQKNCGYVVGPLDLNALAKKARCITCGQSAKKRVRPPRDKKKPTESGAAESSKDAQPPNEDNENQQDVDPDEEEKEADELEYQLAGANSKAKDENTKPVINQCRWHTKHFFRGRYQCCGGNGFSPGCESQPSHDPEPITAASIFERWTFYGTPEPSAHATPRKAVALDCEMGTNMHGESELIRLSLVDYFSNEVLIDSLVFPNEPLRHCNTKWTGIIMRDLREAKAKGEAIRGRDKARNKILKFVCPDTIVIVHGGTGDFSCLRWIHFKVVDTVITERRRKSRAEGNALSLKKLCELRLGLLVQQRSAHCSLEDARATRALANFYVENEDIETPKEKKSKKEPLSFGGPEYTF